jgi:hypothetical protein
MADFQKRAKQTRKQAAKRAKKTQKRARGSVKATRKAVEKTSVRTRAQTLAAIGVAIGAAAAIGRLLKGGGDDGGQRYSSEPDGLPNQPERPVATTPPPGAATAQTGADTGTQTETERARIEQAG